MASRRRITAAGTVLSVISASHEHSHAQGGAVAPPAVGRLGALVLRLTRPDIITRYK